MTPICILASGQWSKSYFGVLKTAYVAFCVQQTPSFSTDSMWRFLVRSTYYILHTPRGQDTQTGNWPTSRWKLPLENMSTSSTLNVKSKTGKCLPSNVNEAWMQVNKELQISFAWGVFSLWTRQKSCNLTCDWQNGGSHWTHTCHVTSLYARMQTLNCDSQAFFVVLMFTAPNIHIVEKQKKRLLLFQVLNELTKLMYKMMPHDAWKKGASSCHGYTESKPVHSHLGDVCVSKNIQLL